MSVPSSMREVKPSSAAPGPLSVGPVRPPKPTEFLPMPLTTKAMPTQKIKLEDKEDLDDITQMKITIDVPNNR